METHIESPPKGVSSQQVLLITGGAGYIGSNTCALLLAAGYSLVVIDNLSNSSSKVLEAVAKISGLDAVGGSKWRHPDGFPCLHFVSGDVRSYADLDAAFRLPSEKVSAVIHLAGMKSAGESQIDPLGYWETNVNGTINLLRVMQEKECQALVFSSSAAVYGDSDSVPIPESSPFRPMTPYAQTKATVEKLLNDIALCEQSWRICILRYFNPIGAHPSGLIGERPNGFASNIFPVICEVAKGAKEHVQVFGNDWPTPDGSAIRDYIHVLDLADGHVRAVRTLLDGGSQIVELNLGTGKGYSVFEIISCFERVTGQRIPHIVTSRRQGDLAISIADSSKAQSLLGWSSHRSLEDMCRDGWAWQFSQNC